MSGMRVQKNALAAGKQTFRTFESSQAQSFADVANAPEADVEDGAESRLLLRSATSKRPAEPPMALRETPPHGA